MLSRTKPVGVQLGAFACARLTSTTAVPASTNASAGIMDRSAIRRFFTDVFNQSLLTLRAPRRARRRRNPAYLFSTGIREGLMGSVFDRRKRREQLESSEKGLRSLHITSELRRDNIRMT